MNVQIINAVSSTINVYLFVDVVFPDFFLFISSHECRFKISTRFENSIAADIYLFVEKGTFCSNSGVGEIMAAITLSTDLKNILM